LSLFASEVKSLICNIVSMKPAQVIRGDWCSVAFCVDVIRATAPTVCI